jgi:phosphoribosylglycinamide formyltransferase-1
MVDWQNDKLKSLVVLLSGTGSTLDNICRHCYEDGGILKNVAQVTQVITDKPKALGIQVAKQYGAIPYIVPYDPEMEPREDWRRRITRCIMNPVDLVVLAGFTQLIDVDPKFAGKIVNVHPSLLPRHGGKGMYGRKVHEAVLASGDKVTGCTVHLVDGEYDHGPVLAQREVQILEGDTVENLTEKVKAAERELYPQTIRNLLVSNDKYKQAQSSSSK